MKRKNISLEDIKADIQQSLDMKHERLQKAAFKTVTRIQRLIARGQYKIQGENQISLVLWFDRNWYESEGYLMAASETVGLRITRDHLTLWGGLFQRFEVEIIDSNKPKFNPRERVSSKPEISFAETYQK